MTAEKIKELAEELVARLKEDIHKAVTREEHIRTSARANEADLLLEALRAREVEDEAAPADGSSADVS